MILYVAYKVYLRMSYKIVRLGTPLICRQGLSGIVSHLTFYYSCQFISVAIVSTGGVRGSKSFFLGR